MDQKHVTGSLRDELGLAIEASVAVEAAPALRALVRARVDRERVTAARWARWQVASVGALVTIIAVVTLAPWQHDATESTPASEIAAVHLSPVVPVASAAQRAMPKIERPEAHKQATRAASPNEAAVFRAYVDHVRQLRIDPSALSSVRSSNESLAVSAIGIAPIAIEPLPKLSAITGEHQ